MIQTEKNRGYIMLYDLSKREPFSALSITAPEQLASNADYTQLFHYLLSEFHRILNSFTAVYGYYHRQRLLGALYAVLTRYMPRVEPNLVAEYPASLERIELLVAQTIVEAVAKTA